MKRVLILGAGDAQTDAIEYCRAEGYEVIGCSYTTVEKGISHLDHFENTDIKDRQAVLDLAEKYGVDLVYSTGSDIAIPVAMYVSEKLGLPHFVSSETAVVCFVKDMFREKLGNDFEGNIPYAVFSGLDDALLYDEFPAMMKPVDSQGQRGCYKVSDTDDIRRFFDASAAHSGCGRVIIERYIEGREISANAFFDGGRMIFCIISDRISYDEYPGGIIREHRIPSAISDKEKERAEDLVVRAAEKLGINDGPCYMQMKIGDDGMPGLIEAAPRLDGCHLWRLIRQCCGADLLDAAFRQLNGEAVSFSGLPQHLEQGYRLTFISREPGTVFSTDTSEAADEDTIFYQYYYDQGDKVRKKNGHYEKCGYVIRKMRGRELEKKKLAIIGAALFQEPAILKAKEMGFETHVFAWEAGDPGEKMADHFYPISIREKEEILEKCREIGIDGIISIASDLAMVTVNYVAENMGLTGNSTEATFISTNKHAMREAFVRGGDPSPKSTEVDADTDLSIIDMSFPLIVKPTDRSGSRGVKIVEKKEDLADAIDFAINESFEKKAVVEEFAKGDEYSVEYISCRGKHYLLAITEKTTSGAPWFIEMSHIEPAPVSEERREKIRRVCDHALDTLMLYDGAGHIELKVDGNENVKIIEIGGRMGGGFIGSDLVELSTGYDYVGNVIKIAMGEEIGEPELKNAGTAGIKFITRKKDLEEYRERVKNDPGSIVREGRDGGAGSIDSINIDDLKDEPDNIKDRIAYYIYKV